MHEPSLLFNAILYLAAAVIAVPVFKRLGLGAVLGYLVAGVVIGPWGFGLIRDVDLILRVSELGVVLLLFLIGLELNPQRLWEMRRPVLGLGGAQVASATLALTAAGVLFGLDWHAALVAGMGLALSSTAIALQVLEERNLLPTPGGNAGFSVLLFQDLAVIPMLAALPLLATAAVPTVEGVGSGWLETLARLGVVAAIVIGGHYLLRPVLRLIAATGLREIFTAFALLLVTGTAALMQAVDLSMALGAFLAGVLLADSEYRHALESDIEPFKGLLLGLFFIAVGMSIDFGLLLARPLLVLGLVVGLVAVKALLLYALATRYPLPGPQRGPFALILSQGGEFAFVLFSAAIATGALATEVGGLLVGVVALSMMTTPILLGLHDRFIEPRLRLSGAGPARPMDTIGGADHPVIVAGFGRFGQIVARLLNANGIETTVLDHDPEHIDSIRRFGFKVFYGDAARLDLLRAAGADHARLLVLAIDDRAQALKIVGLVHEHFPRLTILARAWDMRHLLELRDRGVAQVERETFEGALRLGEQALHRLGRTAWQAKQAANRFRAHDHALIDDLLDHFQADIEVRAAISASARARLREEMEADAAVFSEAGDQDWH